jgi:hypothetical protein
MTAPGSRAIALATAMAIAALLTLPGASQAACGGTEVAQPTHRVHGQLPPLAIGDSTMLLSLPGLASHGFTANAHGCRQFFQAVQLLAQLKAAGQLPRLVAIALGANGTVTGPDIDSALRVLGPKRLLVLVTPRELGGGAGSDAATERAAARARPGRILLLDWVAYSAGHGSWFQPDGLHLTLSGAAALTDLIARALPYAYDVPGC